MPGNMSVRSDHDDEDHNNDVHALVVIIDENESDLLDCSIFRLPIMMMWRQNLRDLSASKF